MAIPHATSGQIVNVLAPGEGLPLGTSYALFKTDQLEVIRLVLPAGKAFPPHKVGGEVTVQCLAGVFEVSTPGQFQVIRPGQLLYLASGVEHGLLAVEDATALVTIALRK